MEETLEQIINDFLYETKELCTCMYGAQDPNCPVCNAIDHLEDDYYTSLDEERS